MVLTVSSFYSEVGVHFKISHKVDLYIRNLLIENIMVPFGLDKMDVESMLNLNVTTSSSTKEVEVKGPVVDKRNKVYSYGLWLPYETIMRSRDSLSAYLLYYFEAVAEVFKKYGIEAENLKNVKKNAEKEIIGNANYYYEDDDESIPPPDLSDIID